MLCLFYFEICELYVNDDLLASTIAWMYIAPRPSVAIGMMHTNVLFVVWCVCTMGG